ncbi:MAG: hypothetical protein KDA63_15155, partial [Planctomycetales bacterium]|nr:hypothetical protein [Planctomycetales bacterium]
MIALSVTQHCLMWLALVAGAGQVAVESTEQAPPELPVPELAAPELPAAGEVPLPLPPAAGVGEVREARPAVTGAIVFPGESLTDPPASEAVGLQERLQQLEELLERSRDEARRSKERQVEAHERHEQQLRELHDQLRQAAREKSELMRQAVERTRGAAP